MINNSGTHSPFTDKESFGFFKPIVFVFGFFFGLFFKPIASFFGHFRKD